jgi:hypothetical protein
MLMVSALWKILSLLGSCRMVMTGAKSGPKVAKIFAPHRHEQLQFFQE